MPHISKDWLDCLEAVDKNRIFFDSELPSFGVRVTPSGHKSFVVEFRPGGASRGAGKKRLKIGMVGVLSVREARTRAKKLLAEVALGGDPGEVRQAKRAESTLAEAYADYQATKLPALRPRTKASYEVIFRLYLLPALRNKKLSDITSRDLTAIYTKIATDGHPSQARRTLAVFKAFWGWLRDSDSKFALPCPVTMKLRKEKPKERFLTLAELERLAEAINAAETIGVPWKPQDYKKGTPGPEHRRSVISKSAGNAIRMLALTGCRLREILHLTWGEVKLDEGFLRLAQTKTGAKTIVLSRGALAILQETYDSLATTPRNSDPVFPESIPVGDLSVPAAERPRPQPRHDLKRPWSTVCRAAGLENVRLHDLRHTVASHGLQAGLSLAVIGRMLGHASIQATQRYSHLDVSGHQRAVDLVASRIEGAMLPAAAEELEEDLIG